MHRHVLGSFACVCTLLLICSCGASPTHAQQSTYLKYHSVEAAVETAQRMLLANGVKDTSHRMPLMVLYSHYITDRSHGPCLKCAFDTFKDNLMPNTPADLFLFTRQEHILPMLRLSWIRNMPNLYIMPLDEGDEHSWSLPKWLRPMNGRKNVSGWSGGSSIDYRLMGQWRLAFSFPFVKALGYRYLMQIDSDTYVRSKIEYNLVSFMHERQLYMTNRDFFFNEVRDYALGLPELARFWMVTRMNLLFHNQDVTVETAASAGIRGPILKHCKPQNLRGLITQTTRTASDDAWEGWDAQCIAGNFNIFSLDFWFQDDVQDFVQMVLRSGAHLEHRWVDVATESMIWQLFVPEDKFHVFKDINVVHGHNTVCNPCGSDWLSSNYTS